MSKKKLIPALLPATVRKTINICQMISQSDFVRSADELNASQSLFASLSSWKILHVYATISFEMIVILKYIHTHTASRMVIIHRY